MTFPFGETVTLHTRSGFTRDSDGNQTPVFVDVAVDGCAFNPGGSSELVQGQDLVVTQPTVYMPAGTVVGATDQVTARGDRYDVDGSPNAWSNPFTGWAPGVEVKLKAGSG